MSYWLMARGSSKAVIIAEGFSCVCSVLLPLVLIPILGLAGAGLAFCLGHAIYALTLVSVSRWRSGGWIGRPALQALVWAALLMGGTQILAPHSWIIVTTAIALVGAVTSWFTLRRAWATDDTRTP